MRIVCQPVYSPFPKTWKGQLILFFNHFQVSIFYYVKTTCFILYICSSLWYCIRCKPCSQIRISMLLYLLYFWVLVLSAILWASSTFGTILTETFHQISQKLFIRSFYKFMTVCIISLSQNPLQYILLIFKISLWKLTLCSKVFVCQKCLLAAILLQQSMQPVSMCEKCGDHKTATLFV